MENIYTNKNTTCFIFTAKKENEEYEKIIFLLATDEYTLTPKKEIEIISNGVEVFKKDNVIYKQYFFVGLKEKMKKTIDTLYKNKETEINNILFKIPKSTKRNKVKIESFKSFQYYKIHRYNCDTNDFFDKIGFNLIKENIDTEVNIKLENNYSNKIFPLFYIKPSSLKEYILNNNVIIYKELLFKNMFKGIESKVKGEVGELKGYLQMDNLDIKDISIILKNKKDNKEMKAIIDNKTGEYSIKSSDDIFRGELIYFHKGKGFHSEDYSLIKDFKIDFNILDTTVELIGGQKVNFSKEKLKDNDLIKNYEDLSKDKSFFKDSYANLEDYIKATTDYIKKIFCICSPNILICDPYFLGEIKDNKVNNGQKIFINALILAMTEYKIKNFYILGNSKNKKFKNGYSNLIKDLKKINPKLNIEIFVSNSNFHDRVILNVDFNKKYSDFNENIKIFKIGTSINGWESSGELNITEISDENTKSKMYSMIMKRIEGEK
ncbi:hypothetical protein [Fusobacterium pseudoperiodonticum]|jgi:hypothetical protein|uniref:hypothetical protein n=1 Tax=Fusobacterium pseudoperiodonticum TaxID=2663009 RepID=UPI000C1BAC07|nr:hypothetical protein [Fusobacterium pseudoperiodonticum]ATV63105.1 hypothetical protein CTM78_01015 [Fusobacterium pseudoperiodonticum]